MRANFCGTTSTVPCVSETEVGTGFEALLKVEYESP